jgi:hypothetical protein
MSDLPETVGIDEQATAAGRIKHGPDDPISALRSQCLAFIDGANLSQHARMMALPKLEEMIFWIRAGTG